MAKAVVYSKEHCPYCDNAKQLLDSKNISFEEVRVDLEPQKLQEMLQLSGGMRTVPQIVINGKHIGGFDDLQKISSSGELDQIVSK